MKKITDAQLAKILVGFSKGTSMKMLAARFKVTPGTIKRYYTKWSSGYIALGAGGTVETFTSGANATTPLTATASF